MSMTLYRVGGFVRDQLLGIPSKDVDFAVEVDSFETMRANILAAGGRIWQERPQFLTIRAQCFGLDADFVMCRKDGAYTDGRRPDAVEPGTILDDLARRDFTCNAIAMTEVGPTRIVDPHGGRDDIRSRTLRAVGDPYDRFWDDGLRPLRAIRFMVTKGFTPDPWLHKALSDDHADYWISNVSRERVRDEINVALRFDAIHTLRTLAQFPDLERAVFSRGVRLDATLKG